MDLYTFILSKESGKHAPDNRYMFEGKEFVKVGKVSVFSIVFVDILFKTMFDNGFEIKKRSFYIYVR